MENAIRLYLESLGKAVQATAILADRKNAVVGLLKGLPAMYALLRETRDNRYDDQITRAFRGVLKELTDPESDCPLARKLAEAIPDEVHHLHEQLGLPRLVLRTPSPPPRVRKARKTHEEKKRTA